MSEYSTKRSLSGSDTIERLADQPQVPTADQADLLGASEPPAPLRIPRWCTMMVAAAAAAGRPSVFQLRSRAPTAPCP